MTELNIGDVAPDFVLPASDNNNIKLSAYKGQYVVLYFYPKDDTPGCTKQACAFEENLKAFEKIEAAVIGISKDSISKHEKFKTKYNLSFPLASDEDNTVCENYGVWKEKNMYGKKYMGIERTTFLVGPDGKIEHIWQKVKVPGHVEDVLDTLKGKKTKAA
jgi:peroxiredoxin Q/BCP